MGTYFKKGNERFTYYCCLYPYGFLLNPGPIKESIPYYEIYVNQKDIEKIVFLGNIN